MNDHVNDRLKRLERSNRHLRVGLALLVGGLVVGVAGGIGLGVEPANYLVASSMNIVDEDGNKMVWIGSMKNKGQIQVCNLDGDEIWVFPTTPPPAKQPRPNSKDQPEPLTQEMIQAMTLQEVEVAVSRVAKARQYAAVDDETKLRLKKEFNMLISRMRDLKSKR
ncbi:MAG: hypothetical protein O7G85_08620 [Planctomycetota bacterium]|nr:hypothetical protein [Planctomycetota bacterium]